MGVRDRASTAWGGRSYVEGEGHEFKLRPILQHLKVIIDTAINTSTIAMIVIAVISIIIIIIIIVMLVIIININTVHHVNTTKRDNEQQTANAFENYCVYTLRKSHTHKRSKHKKPTLDIALDTYTAEASQATC